MLVAGPGEFLPDSPQASGHQPIKATHGHLRLLPPPPQPSPPSAQALKTSLTAYNLLRFDTGWLSQNSSQAFQHATGNIPHGFHPVATEPVSILREQGPFTVGIVLFPPGTLTTPPSQKQIEQVIQAGKALQKKADLIIGISPWGITTEKTFLSLASGVFDILFGGGDGIGFSHSVTEESPSTLWVRSDSLGRAITRVTLFSPPRATPRFFWKSKENFESDHIFLGPSYPDHPDMKKIIGTAPR